MLASQQTAENEECGSTTKGHGGGPDLPLPEAWHQLAERLRRANGARASRWEANRL